jgi:hypothetical protein
LFNFPAYLAPNGIQFGGCGATLLGVVPRCNHHVASAIGMPNPARAGDGFGAGLFGGLIAGTILGETAASPRYYGPPLVYDDAEPIYAVPSCYWTRGAPVWDDYRGIWVRPRYKFGTSSPS